MVNAQEWLESQEEYNTKEKREKITELDINNKKLEGELNLRDFAKLKRFNCSLNRLTSLDLTDLNNLEKIECNSNWLTSFDYSVLNSDRLVELNISDNNRLPKQDLSVFSRFVNLENLCISDNLFFGSLSFLQSLRKLKELDIVNTNIDSGLEFLPESLEKFYCSSSSSLARELKDYNKDDEEDNYDYQSWRRDNLSSKRKSIIETEIPSKIRIRKSSKALTGWLIKIYIGESKENKDKERRVMWGKLEDEEIYFREEDLKNELKEEKLKKLLERPEFVVKNRINFAWDEGDNNEEILADESENVIWGVDEKKRFTFEKVSPKKNPKELLDH